MYPTHQSGLCTAERKSVYRQKKKNELSVPLVFQLDCGTCSLGTVSRTLLSPQISTSCFYDESYITTTYSRCPVPKATTSTILASNQGPGVVFFPNGERMHGRAVTKVGNYYHLYCCCCWSLGSQNTWWRWRGAALMVSPHHPCNQKKMLHTHTTTTCLFS